MALVEVTKSGLYCPHADIYIDPWRSVHRALITHAHSDHARPGSKLYVSHLHTVPLLKRRLGKVNTEGVEYGKSIRYNDVNISFHPAGHVPGSAQIRIEYRGEVCVVSGDYKLEDDGLSVPFEPVKCHTFITESTFGLPIYKWQNQQEIFNEINAWWSANADENITSVLIAYSLGKAQRLLMHLDSRIGQVIVHPAVFEMNEAIREFYPQLPLCLKWTNSMDLSKLKNALLIMPSAAAGDPWMSDELEYDVAFASGWMGLRGTSKWSGGKGFTLSDHADWEGLCSAVNLCGAEEIFVTHGYSSVFSKWLCEQGKNARELKTLFSGDESDVDLIHQV